MYFCRTFEDKGKNNTWNWRLEKRLEEEEMKKSRGRRFEEERKEKTWRRLEENLEGKGLKKMREI